MIMLTRRPSASWQITAQCNGINKLISITVVKDKMITKKMCLQVFQLSDIKIVYIFSIRTKRYAGIKIKLSIW